MKKRLQGFTAGVIATLMLTGVFAVAKNMYEKIDVFYNNITIEIDGEEFVATDANGTVVEPFIYNGTTYLPVRAIAEAFDKDVAWDEETYTVSLTSKTEETPEYDTNLTEEQLIGTWSADVSSLLTEFGVSESIAGNYNIPATVEFGSDGGYKMYFSEDAVSTLMDASFEYALTAYGMTAEEYSELSGMSIEETKAQMMAELELADLSEEGTYRIENGVLYMLVEGSPEKIQNYTFDGTELTLYENGAALVLVKVLPEE